MLKTFATAIAAAALLSVAACGQSAEKTGENLDSSIENATQGHENLSDGPLEQTGEAVDHATGTERSDSAADAVNDATDNNSNTRP
jgi:hypothetical protein